MYSITKPYMGYEHFLPITEEQFVQARTAHRNLLISLSIEEKYNLVLENYEELEQELLSVSLKRALFAAHSWSDKMGQMHTLGRRLINLLSTCRLYFDQLCHSLASVYGNDSTQLTSFNQWRAAEYDSRLGYRTMEALRNYVQHRGLPFDGIGHYIKNIDNPDGTPAKSIVTPSLKVSRLKEDGGFKSTILTELESSGKDVEVKSFVRDYIEGIRQVHARLREMLETDVATWEAVIEGFHTQYGQAFDEDTRGIVAVEQPTEGIYNQTISLTFNIIERRKWLEQRNSFENPLDRTIITNE